MKRINEVALQWKKKKQEHGVEPSNKKYPPDLINPVFDMYNGGTKDVKIIADKLDLRMSTVKDIIQTYPELIADDYAVWQPTNVREAKIEDNLDFVGSLADELMHNPSFKTEDDLIKALLRIRGYASIKKLVNYDPDFVTDVISAYKEAGGRIESYPQPKVINVGEEMTLEQKIKHLESNSLSESALDKILEKNKVGVRHFKSMDVWSFDETPELKQLYDDLFTHYTNNGEMPYGIAKARDGDPIEWIVNELNGEFDL
jgi:hypothetical protein